MNVDIMKSPLTHVLIIFSCMLHPSSSRLLGSSFVLSAFDIFYVSVSVIFDYIVVRAGTACLPVAVRLAGAGSTVALIKTGSLHHLGNGNLSQVPLYASPFQHTCPVSMIAPMVECNLTTTPQAGLHRLYLRKGGRGDVYSELSSLHICLEE